MTELLSRVDSPKALRALPEEQLPALCAALRAELIDICGQVGGHLGASLGAVELIVALHRVFRTPHDALVFDVGHQAYAHKLLTGRRERMRTLRKEGGIAPFLDPKESPHDAFAAGHACTAVSVALGMAEAQRRGGPPERRVVAIAGDGALTGGLTFEGLNHAAPLGAPITLVLNDNEMSISRSVGALSRALRDGGARSFFEALGWIYLGPIDGHDLRQLISAFREARKSRRPVVVHALTEKGRGFTFAEEDVSTRGHAMGPYELRDGKLVRSRGGHKTFSEAFAEALESRMASDPRVVAVTPAMVQGSALTQLQARFPDRCYDVGIAEPHALAFAAGLAAKGLRPVCLIYSTFLQRGYDQLIHDICLPGLPVIVAIDRAGLVGADGATHQGAFDLAMLNAIPGLAVGVPSDAPSMTAMLDWGLGHAGPMAIRFPRGTLPEPMPSPQLQAEPVTRSRWLKWSDDAQLTLVAVGPLIWDALTAASGRDWNVLDARWMKPLDEEPVLAAGRMGPVVTLEEGTLAGGFGTSVRTLLGSAVPTCRVKCLGLPDRFIPHGEARAQRVALGLDPAGIVRSAEELLR